MSKVLVRVCADMRHGFSFNTEGRTVHKIEVLYGRQSLLKAWSVDQLHPTCGLAWKAESLAPALPSCNLHPNILGDM